MMATQSDAHREWHLNSGVPMGQPGCPQDACHPVEDFADEPTVRCGNKAAHGGEPGYHYSASEVRACYGVLAQPEPVSVLCWCGVPIQKAGSGWAHTAKAQHDLAQPLHESPCVCGPYDRCRGVRAKNAADSGNWRDRFRAYND